METAAPARSDRILSDIPALDTADLLENLSLESQTKPKEVTQPAKKAGGSANNSHKPFNRSTTPIHMDPGAYYFSNGYTPATYYGGYDGHGGEWSSGFMNADQGMFGDSGALLYPQGYGYSAFGSYPADSTLSGAGDYTAQQHYQYPNGFYQHQASGGNVLKSSKAEAPNSASSGAEKVPSSVGAAVVNSNNVTNSGNVNRISGPKPFKPSNQNASSNSNGSYKKGSSSTGYPSSGYQDARYGYDGYQSPIPFLDMSMYTNVPSRPTSGSGFSSTMNSHPTRPGQAGFMSYVLPSRIYGQYGSRTRPGYGAYGYNAWPNARWTGGDNKYRYRGRGYGNENGDGLSELNRGPRAKGLKTQNELDSASQTAEKQEQPLSENNCEDPFCQIPDMEQINKEDFPENYSDAKFFVIKSYSEDDVHKSVKYGVWTSTLNGNKKLDAAYQKAKETPGGCPVFLLFSVNTSGQFVGLAEMTGPVEFNKSVEYWQQEKWVGYFPVKWHIIKDVPNSSLRHITLENNENKPVTNSRDTQEVYLEQGVQIIKVFKAHKGKTSILDDFGFYADRERKMQEKKAKQKSQKQMVDVKDGEVVMTEDKEKAAAAVTGKENRPVPLDADSNTLASATTELP